MKKIFISLLLMLQVVTSVSPLMVLADDETTTVIVHYKASEDNDKDWNLWVWPSMGEGSVYEFTEEDSYGKIAIITLDGSHDEVGFIVRTDEWEKDTPNDRFITQFDNGVGEIWLEGGNEAIAYENPNGPDGIQEDSVELLVHYNNYDGLYDHVKMFVLVGDETLTITDTSVDAFGYTGKMIVNGTKGLSALEVQIEDKTISSYPVKKITEGQAEIYMVQNNDRVFYGQADAVTKPAALEAKLNNSQTITMTMNMPFKGSKDDVVVLVNGEAVTVASFLFDALNEEFLVQEGIIMLKESVNYLDDIKILLPKFEEIKVSLGNVFDTEEFKEAFTYTGNDLGPVYKKEATTFKVWAPTAKNMSLTLYEDYKDTEGRLVEMMADDNGTWAVTIEGDLHNQLYDYFVSHQNESIHAVDPYAKAVTVNGSKSAVVDLERTNPENWNLDYKTNFTNPTDAIMYELHIRDLSMHPDSNIENKGLFLGLTELDTKTSNGYSTGLSYIKELGVTHIQLLPIYDYGSIDESKNEYKFNWGYDPVNYNALEGSYSTDPYTPDVRINEFKQLVQAVHDQDLKVTMDVVYNHVYSLNAMAFEKLVPGYYFRKEGDNYANGSGCGNETASERPMMRKFMVDSVTYLAEEFKLDGFRFDLMGLHDVETMNEIRAALNEIDPSITMIGEGWNMGVVLEASEKANQEQAYLMPGIAHFNDTIRDGLKGSVFESLDQGFVNGKEGMAGVVFSGILGGVDFDTYSTWGNIDPTQSVTYVEAHDNNTLYDKLKISNPEDSEATIKKMHMLADSIVLTSQGVSFIHAGQEFMRTKFGDHNSYMSSDIINRLDWSRREANDDVVTYFKGMIDMRKTHPAFRMSTAEMVNTHLNLLQASDNLIAYELQDVPGESWDHILVIHNGNRTTQTLLLDENKKWTVVVKGEEVDLKGLESLEGKTIEIDELSTMVLYASDQSTDLADENGENKGLIWVGLLAGVLLVGLFVFFKKK